MSYEEQIMSKENIPAYFRAKLREAIVLSILEIFSQHARFGKWEKSLRYSPAYEPFAKGVLPLVQS